MRHRLKRDDFIMQKSYYHELEKWSTEAATEIEKLEKRMAHMIDMSSKKDYLYSQIKEENILLKEIAIYVRDNHLCGTPLQKSIDMVVSKEEVYTTIKKV